MKPICNYCNLRILTCLSLKSVTKSSSTFLSSLVRHLWLCRITQPPCWWATTHHRDAVLSCPPSDTPPASTVTRSCRMPLTLPYWEMLKLRWSVVLQQWFPNKLLKSELLQFQSHHKNVRSKSHCATLSIWTPTSGTKTKARTLNPCWRHYQNLSSNTK